MTVKGIILELTIDEAKLVKKSIASGIPSKEDEMIVLMLYSRITRKIEEATGIIEPR